MLLGPHTTHELAECGAVLLGHYLYCLLHAGSRPYSARQQDSGAQFHGLEAGHDLPVTDIDQVLVANLVLGQGQQVNLFGVRRKAAAPAPAAMHC